MSKRQDRITNYYSGVNWEIVWDVIAGKLPELKTQIARISKWPLK